MTDLTRAMAAADQPVAIFEAIHQTVNDVVGVTLFTIMRLNREKGVAERIFSNMPEAYPAGGESRSSRTSGRRSSKSASRPSSPTRSRKSPKSSGTTS